MEFKARTIAGKCLTEKPNFLKTCSRCCSCATLSRNGLCSLYKSLPSCHSSLEFSVVKNIPHECCHQSYSYVGKNFCCISPSVSIDRFSSASSVTEKPSGLRMPSPNIGYFDMVSCT